MEMKMFPKFEQIFAFLVKSFGSKKIRACFFFFFVIPRIIDFSLKFYQAKKKVFRQFQMGDTAMTQLHGFDAGAQNSRVKVVLVSRAVIHRKTILSLIKINFKIN